MKFSEHKAIYLQIADIICDRVLNSTYLADERIPSIRELGPDLGVNPNTVMRTYEYLKSLNIIYDKRGLGFFISPEAMNIVKNLYKREFYDIELPAIVKKMKLLDINVGDLAKKIDELLGTHLYTPTDYKL